MMFLLGINSDLRVGDLLQLKVKDIKGKKNVMMKEGKTGKPRTIYSKSIYDELNDFIRTQKGTEWLFPSGKVEKTYNKNPGLQEAK
jgi:integrase